MGFGWLFIPSIAGMVIGSMLAARYAARVSPGKLIAYGYAATTTATFANVIYNLFYVAAVPWAVLPFALYALGMALIGPSMTVIILDLFPEARGLASSLLSFFAMLIFALISGFVAPLLFDSALKLAWGALSGAVLSVLCWLWGHSRGSALRNNFLLRNS